MVCFKTPLVMFSVPVTQDCRDVEFFASKRKVLALFPCPLSSVVQNRDLFMVARGDGSLALHKYCYPDQRWVASEISPGLAAFLYADRLRPKQRCCCYCLASLDWQY